MTAVTSVRQLVAERNHTGPLHLRDRTAHGLMRKLSCAPQALACVLQCYAVVAALPPVTAKGPLGTA
jgi:hypothetical protein